MSDAAPEAILTLTTVIVSSYVGNKAHVSTADIPGLIRSVRAALTETGPPPPRPVKTVSRRAERRRIDRSITAEALISFIDNKPYRSLERHLKRHGLDMAGYRERYGLPSEYPSVAPNFKVAEPKGVSSRAFALRRSSVVVTSALPHLNGSEKRRDEGL